MDIRLIENMNYKVLFTSVLDMRLCYPENVKKTLH